MVKLSKMQAQAIISKLEREANILRDKLIEDEKKNYTLSSEAKTLVELLEKRDKYKALSDEAADEARKLVDSLGISGFYTYTKIDEVLSKIKTKDIETKYPKIDASAALDDLIIESIEDDFDVNKFIEQYLKQMRK